MLMGFALPSYPLHQGLDSFGGASGNIIHGDGNVVTMTGGSSNATGTCGQNSIIVGSENFGTRGCIVIGRFNNTTGVTFGADSNFIGSPVPLSTLGNQPAKDAMQFGHLNLAFTTFAGASTLGVLQLGISNSSTLTFGGPVTQVGSSNTTTGSGGSWQFGHNNTLSGNSNNCQIGTGNSNTVNSGQYNFQIGVNNSVSGNGNTDNWQVGDTNSITGTGTGGNNVQIGMSNTCPNSSNTPAKQTVQIGYFNQGAYLNAGSVGVSNFLSTNGLASWNFGLLNNQQTGSLNTTTGVVTGTPAAATTIGRLCIAVGILNLTSGNISGAFGYSCNSSADNAWSFGASVANSTTNTVEIGASNTDKIRSSTVGLTVVKSNGSLAFKVGGTIFEHYADAGNGTTVETDLYSDTIPASTLMTNGDKLEAEYGGTFVSSGTATREIKIYFGGTAIFDTGALTLSLSSAWTAFATIIRVSTTVVRYMISFTTQGAALSAYTAVGELTGLTLSNTNVMKITGQAAGVSAATNDVTAKLGIINYQPAA